MNKTYLNKGVNIYNFDINYNHLLLKKSVYCINNVFRYLGYRIYSNKLPRAVAIQEFEKYTPKTKYGLTSTLFSWPNDHFGELWHLFHKKFRGSFIREGSVSSLIYD